MLNDRALDLAKATSTDDRQNPRAPTPLKSEAGFSLILLLSLLPAGLALMFAILAGSNIIKERRQAMNDCRRELSNGLNAASKPMQKLLETNPEATTLQMELTSLEADEAAALSMPPLAAAIAAQISKVRAQQALLDLKQKTLYLEAESLLNKSQVAAFFHLKNRDLKGKILRISARTFSSVRPALHRIRPGIAPEWEVDTGFSDAQALEQKWQWSFTIRGAASNFLNASHMQEEKCSATFENQPPPWHIVLR